jgi:transcriptional regulator with PAS, ATPase and Fis domain
LRALQEREVRRVGALTATPVDVRIIAATRRDLPRDVVEGRFREDLFYRLNVFVIALPPLRERVADIPLLVERALRSFRRQRATLTCSPLAMRMLRAYSWPGNVRQLVAVLESAAIRTDGVRIEAQHLPEEVRSALTGSSQSPEKPRLVSSADDERAMIVAVLDEAAGSRSRAAEILGIGRTTLWRRMKQYGIIAEGEPDSE